MKEEEREKFKEKIDDRITTSFSITFIPVKDFRDFKKLAEEEFRDNYAMTLKFLMENWKRNQFFLEQINAIWKKLNDLERKESKFPKTFENV